MPKMAVPRLPQCPGFPTAQTHISSFSHLALYFLFLFLVSSVSLSRSRPTEWSGLIPPEASKCEGIELTSEKELMQLMSSNTFLDLFSGGSLWPT